MNTVPLQAVKSTRNFDNWIEAYTSFTDNTEAPLSFRTWTAIATLAGALGRKAWVNIGRFTVAPSFYIVFVAPPGVATKSTTASVGINLLKEGTKANVFTGAITRQAIMDELEDGVGQVQIGNKLLEMTSVTMFASELGVLLGGHDMQLVDTFVDVWDSKPEIEKRTRGEGKKSIPRPFINLLGCTTPGWLQANSEAYSIDGGLFSRTIFVYADKKEKLIAYPDETTDDTYRKQLMADLAKIGEMRGEFTLTAEALEWGRAWYEQLYRNPPEHLANEMFQAYVSRRQTHLHKTALIISAASSTDQVITLEHLVVAESVLYGAEQGLAKIYQAVMSTEKTHAYNLIIKLLSMMPQGVGKQALFKMLGSKVTLAEFESGLQAAIFAGQVKMKDTGKDYVIFPCMESN